MYDDPFETLIGDRSQRSRGNVHPLPSKPRRIAEPDPTGKEYMLADDMRSHALPYGRGLDDGFKLTLTSEDPRAAEIITNALPAPFYRTNNLSDAFRGYVELAITQLLRGNLYLMIEYFRAANEPASRPIAFSLDVLPSELIETKFGKTFYWQQTPASERESPRWARELLDPSRIVSVALPGRLRRDLDKARRIIRIADQDLDVMHRFTIGEDRRNSGFNLSEYQRRSNDIVLRETSAIGWSGRGLFTEDLLDPMKAWRAIQFARFEMNLLATAQRGLQTAITRAGGQIGFEASISLSGVLTQAELDQLETELQDGRRPMTELLNPSPLT